MRSVAKTIKSFVGGFGLPAYAVGNVPKDVQLPYLVYPITEPEWDQKASFYIQGWYRTNSYSAMLEKADAILREIGTGVILSTETGYAVIYPETPVLQIISDDENETRSFYLNLSINAYHKPGV